MFVISKLFATFVLLSCSGNVLSYQFGGGLYNRPSRPRTLDAQYWTETLQLMPNPIGGQFSEIYRSDETIASGLPERYGNGNRSLGSSLFIMLQSHEVSVFRAIRSDEFWHFCFGRPVTIYVINPETGVLEIANLGPREDHQFFYFIPRGHFFAARLKNPEQGGYVLFGSTIIPGFAFPDDALSIPTRRELLERFPQHREVIEELARDQDDNRLILS